MAATAGIVAVGHRLKILFDRCMPAVVGGPLALALSAQLFVTPVLLPIAEGVTLYSIPANIVAGPLLPFAVVPGTLAAVLVIWVPWLATALLWLAGLPAAGIAGVGHFVSSLPQALAPWPPGWQGWVMAGIYTVAAIALCVLIIQSRWPGAVELGLLSAAAGTLLSVAVPSSALFSPGPPEHWRFALCDVGQGDMLVVRTGDQEAIVVDAGEHPGKAHECLNRLDVDTVDTLMITHEHLDHYGGTPGLSEAADVKEVVYSGSAGWLPSEAVMELAGAAPDWSQRRAMVGERHQHHGDYPGAWSVWAAADYHAAANDNSLVTLFEVWDEERRADATGSANDPLRLLALGDLEEEVTSIMLRAESLPEHVDVLKVAHHGAANGGTESLYAMEPDVALIGVGEDNSYGHPDAKVLSSLAELRTSVYRTDKHGTVVFSLSAQELQAERLD